MFVPVKLEVKKTQVIGSFEAWKGGLKITDLQEALMVCLEPMAQAARAKAPVRTGKLRSLLGVVPGKIKAGYRLTAMVRAVVGREAGKRPHYFSKNNRYPGAYNYNHYSFYDLFNEYPHHAGKPTHVTLRNARGRKERNTFWSKGTRVIPEKPFLRPAFDQNVVAMTEIFQNQINMLLEEAELQIPEDPAI